MVYGDEEYGTSFRYIHIIVFVAFIASFVPLYHIYVTAIYGKSSNSRNQLKSASSRTASKSGDNEQSTSNHKPPNSSSSKPSLFKSRSHSPPPPPSSPSPKSNKGIKLPLKIKICLFISVTLSFMYLIANTIQAIYMFINAESKYLPIILCRVIFMIQLFTYIWGRGVLYCFFILRSQTIFKGSDCSYAKRTIYGMLICPIIVCSFASIPLMMHRWTQFTCYIATDVDGNGMICEIVEKENSVSGRYLMLIIIASQLADIIYSYVCVHLMASKLFKLISQQNQAHDIQSTNATTFHSNTQQTNSMVILISRLFILLCFAIISSFIAVCAVIFIGARWIVIYYSIDACVNMYCLWLNFGFASEYYYKCFCGHQCITCCFPLVKTLALTCNECNSEQSKNCCKQCNICCCYCCKYCCDKISRDKQLKLYIMSRAETELMTI